MWKKILFAASLLIGVAGVCIVFLLVDVDEALDTVGEVGIPCILAYFFVCIGTLVFPAIGWCLLLRAEGIRVSLLTTVKANFMGFPINIITPSLYLGAEPVKVLYIAAATGAPKRRILATIIVSKFQEFVGLILVLVVCAIYFVWHSNLSRREETIIIITTVILTIALGLIFTAFVGNLRPTVRLLNFLARLGIAPRRMIRLRQKAIEMEERVHAAFVTRWRRFLLVQAITLFSALTIFLRPVIFFLFLAGQQGILMEHVAAIYIVTNVVNTLTFVPGSLGFYEGGITGYFELVGLEAQHGLALVLVNRIADAAMFLIGISLIMRHGLMAAARGKEKVDLGEESQKRPAD
ncbi:MAG: lysylphosphatidylglycerol synthase transmembrane domain-containing protein [Planctomycetota bacterium]|jgi:uncharacterized protein (TIRG00374 family)